MFNFKKRTYILYHLAFLDWLPTHYFFTPNYPLLAPKTSLFNHHFAFFAMYFMALRGFVYAIAAHIYTFRLAFSCILHCI